MKSATCLMILTLLIFILGSMIFPLTDVATVVTTVTAIIGAFAIWFQMKRERDINEAEFVMNYNTSFIENHEFALLEQKLENYRKRIEAKQTIEKEFEIINDENRQIVINYLVYLEALSVFVKKGVLSIKSIDDLFAYRFFLIMNNSEVQEKELYPERQYYQGCIWLHEKWTKYRKKKKLYILLEDTALKNKILNC